MVSSRAVVSALVLISCVLPVAFSQRTSPPPPEPALAVSLISVVANPEKFQNEKVLVIGVLGFADLDQHPCLYVTEPDARNAVMSNCMRLESFSLSHSDKRLLKYVLLNARVRCAGSKRDMYSCYFDTVSNPLLWEGAKFAYKR